MDVGTTWSTWCPTPCPMPGRSLSCQRHADGFERDLLTMMRAKSAQCEPIARTMAQSSQARGIALIRFEAKRPATATRGNTVKTTDRAKSSLVLALDTGSKDIKGFVSPTDGPIWLEQQVKWRGFTGGNRQHDVYLAAATLARPWLEGSTCMACKRMAGRRRRGRWKGATWKLGTAPYIRTYVCR
jgi:hypothetical protein